MDRFFPGAAVLLIALLVMRALPAGADSIRLPNLFAADDVLSAVVHETPPPREMRIAGTASGDSNVGSLWHLTDQGQSPRAFTGSAGNADLQMTSGIDLRAHDWLISYGQGMREYYSGNHDAAQLWIDLHAAGQTQPRYTPTAAADRIEVAWYGLGRRVHFHAGAVSGQGDLFVRALVADDLLQQALVGEVEGDAFAGMLKMRKADGRVEGHGWSTDARLLLTVHQRIYALVTAEGLLGTMTWTHLPVEDSYLTSVGVFMDADGFLHQFGGVSGAAWRENVTLDIVPAYRIELLAGDRPALLCGAAYLPGDHLKPMLGAAWRLNAQRALDLRLYPAEKQLALGFASAGWRIRVAGDDWLTGNPSEVAVTIAGTMAW